MLKPPSKEKKEKVNVRFRKQEPASAAQLRVPGYGQTPDMSDSSAAKYREKLIASGQIKENPGYNGYLTPEEVSELKKKLIDSGLLKPGAGLARLRASQAMRARKPYPRKEYN